MRVSSIVRLYRVRLRARLMQELFAVAGIAIGVALLFASQVANTSLDNSVRRLTEGIVGQMRFQVAARDSHGFDEKVLSDVARLPGVQAVAPVLQQNANVVGPAGERSVDLVGTDPRLARFGGSIARRASNLPAGARVFTMPAQITKEIGISSIRPVTLEIGSRVAKVLLVPRLLARGAGSLGDSPIGLAPLRTVQSLAGLHGRLTSIYVRSPAHLDRSVRAELERLAGGRFNVTPANVTTTLFQRAASPVDQSTGLFSALSALVGFLFAFNALMLTVPQRRSLIEDLRLDGYTRRMIVEVLALDALVLGVIASALGLLLGEVLSVAVFSSSPGYLSFAFPVGSERIVTWWSAVLAVLGGMIAAAAGVFVPLRVTIFERAMRETQGRSSPRRGRSRWLPPAASVCLVVTTTILFTAPQAAIVGVLTLTAALLFFLPVLLDVAVRACAHLQRMLSDTAFYLSLIELRSSSHRARSLAVAATGAIAVFGSVSIQGARGSLEHGLESSAVANDARAGVWITPTGSSNVLATTAFHDVDSARLARLPGVRSVALYRGSFLDWGYRRAWVLGQPSTDLHPLAASQLVGGDVALASARLREGGWVVLARAIADEYHLRIGEAFTLPTAQPTRLRVAALSTNLGWPPGAIIMNADDYARAWTSRDPSAYQLELAPHASAPAVARLARQTIGSESGLRVETAVERERRQFSTAAQALSRLQQIRTLVVIAAVLAMAAAMGAMIWQRRTRLADMKVDGFSRSVLWRALLWESAILLGLGCGLGAVFGMFGQLLLTRALSVVTGFPVIESSPLQAALGNFALITLVAVAIVAVPGFVAARVRPRVGMPE
jgi:putative ABC transport system permease protein